MLYNICFSPTGGTRKVADILVKKLASECVFVDLCDPDMVPITLTDEDIAVISVPSYGGRVPCTASERFEKINGNNARAVLVCVYGNRAYEDTLAELKDIADWCGFGTIAAVAALAEHSMARSVAAGRPDSQDFVILTAMAEKIKAKLGSGDRSPIQVPGKVPEKPIGNFGGRLAPKATADCSRCGRCADRCPTRAIDKDTLEADKGKCIGCMRCIDVCTREARKLGVVLESLGGVALSVLCATRKENELFLSSEKA